jgi:hypothetical protein
MKIGECTVAGHRITYLARTNEPMERRDDVKPTFASVCLLFSFCFLNTSAADATVDEWMATGRVKSPNNKMGGYHLQTRDDHTAGWNLRTWRKGGNFGYDNEPNSERQ